MPKYEAMLLCPLAILIIFQNTVTGANREVRKIFTVESRINSSNCSVTIVPPTNRPINRVTNARDVRLRPYCQPWDSCRNRCGNGTAMPPYSCSCDPLCTSYGDCCIDYNLVCGIGTVQDVRHKEEQKCLNYNMLSSTYAVVSCPDDYKNDTVKAKCESELSPITSNDGLVYSNYYCAVCNNDNTTFYPWINVNGMFQLPSDSPEVRMCLPVIDHCSINATGTSIQEMQTLCQKYSGPVLGYKSEKYYKNVYCALCNGEVLERLSCPVWSFSGFYSLDSLRESINQLYARPNKKVKTLSRNFDHDRIPASFSILLNFGLDGKERMMFSSESEEEMRINQKRCGKNKIWDPFSNICRTLYCSAEFILIDFQCIHKSEITDDSPETGITPKSFDIEAECVHLTLDLEISYFGILQQNLTDYSQFSNYLQDSLASFFNITRNRIQDLNLSYVSDLTSMEHNSSLESTDEDILSVDVLKFKADFDLCEAPNITLKSEPTVDSIMAMMTSYVSLNNFIFDIANGSGKVSDFRQTIAHANDWCSYGSVEKDYWNQDFALILTNTSDKNTSWIKEVYINKTGKIYEKGQFVANILFKGGRDIENLVNVSEVVLVCESKSTLNVSCPRLLLSRDEYNISSNGTLTYATNPEMIIELPLSQYELTGNHSVMVCYDPDVYRKPYIRPFDEYNLHFDSAQAVLSLILSCISILALAIVLITYLIFPVLRTLPGCNVINLTGSALAMQITFLIGQRNSVQGVYCKVAGMLIHFEILATFFWMNVMAYDLYRTFGAKNMMTRVRDKNLLLWHIVYAYGAPCCIVILAYSLDVWYPDLGAKYGFQNNCWITNKKAALLFFASPLAAIILANSILYVLTVCAISSLQKIIRNKSEHAHRKNDEVLYMRMATVMGFTWALAFLAAWYPQDRLIGQILTYIFIIFNTLQGLFIFFGFVCNKRVLKLYSDAFSKVNVAKVKPCANCENHLCKCQPKITRTISSESTLSTVSNSIPTLISFNTITEK